MTFHGFQGKEIKAFPVSELEHRKHEILKYILAQASRCACPLLF